MSARDYTKVFYTLHNYPVLLDCNFIVDSANGNGLGIRSLKGPGIKAVFMHTSTTPLAGNPNPAAGTIIVQFQDAYFRSFSGGSAIVSPLSGTPIVVTAAGAHIVAGTPYVIVQVGTTTTAEWQSIGVPIGVTPAVGVAFIGSATTGAGVGTGLVEVVSATGSGIDHFETVGDPNTTIGSGTIATNAYGYGGQGAAIPYIIINCMLDTVKTQPADGTVISLQFLMSNSSLIRSGE